MGVTLPPLEFTECISDSPYFRENLRKHEFELEVINQQIKRIIKEVKDLVQAATQLSNAQRSFARCLNGFTFQCIGETQTDEERVIFKSLNEFGDLINVVEDERDNMLKNALSNVVKPLEDFRKVHIGKVKNEKKKFEKQTAKFFQIQERHLNLTTKKQHSLQEADATVNMAERSFQTASMEYVYLIQEFHERKKFEFVETLLSFLFGWLTFYHQGYEVAKDFRPFMVDLQVKIQKTRTNFEDYKEKLTTRMAEVKKHYLEEPIRDAKGCKTGYLFLLEKKAFGTTWTKQYCTYDKETKEFTMLPYTTTKSIMQPEVMVLTSCVRRMSDSIDKRFCFDIQFNSKPGVILTFQALSEQDRTGWLDIMDGKEPTYVSTAVIKTQNSEERILDDIGIQFLKRCIEVLEIRGLEEQGLYRVVGVTSKVNKLLHMGLDRRKCEKLASLDDPLEWESKTITSALKNYLRNLPEPLMTYRYHNGFIAAAKNKDVRMRVNDIHTLTYRIPKINLEVLRLLLKHLSNVAERSNKNLMTVSNLGVCFGPTLLRPEEETVASITDLKFYNVVVEVLIENFEKIFNSEPEIFPIDDKPIRATMNSSNNKGVVALQNNMSGHISPSLIANSYIDAGGTEILHSTNSRNYNSNDNFNNYSRRQNMWKAPYTCTVKAYYEPPIGSNISSSLFNVHETANGSMTRSEHVSPLNNHHNVPEDRAIQRYKQYFMSSVSSHSESNIPNLPYSPTSPRAYSRLGHSSSSSNESISSTSKDGNTYTVTPKKSERLNFNSSHPKGYRSPGNVRVRTLYACLGENDGELSFEPNQIITNVKTSQEPGWLEGTLNGKSGLIPENYVEILP